MSRNGSGVYSLPGTYLATTGETIQAQQHNDPLQDLESDANTARPIVAGGTGASSASGARTELDVPGLSDDNTFSGANTFSGTSTFNGTVSGIAATQAEQHTATATTKYVTPAKQQDHPSAVKAWARYTQSAGTYSLGEGYNIASITHTSAGRVTITYTNALSSSTYAAIVTAAEGGTYSTAVLSTSTTSVSIVLRASSTNVETDVGFSIAVLSLT